MQSPHRPRRFRPLLAGALAVSAASAACASAHSSSGSSSPREGHEITADRIEQSGVTNAWEVLKRYGGLRLSESWNGDPARIQSRRGKSSIVAGSSDVPLIIVDGVRLTDLRVLRQIPAKSIQRVRILGPVEGTRHQGTGASGGVIIIESKSG